jgi:N-acetylmuramoyl-L-alanine amidase
MRKIEFIAIHCSATPNNCSVENIKDYWKRILKWNVVGYHWLIKDGGERVNILDENLISNGVAGFNHNTINVCYIGGYISKNKFGDTRSEHQKRSILILLQELRLRYPNAKIQGHRDFPNVNKLCPCFDAIPEYNDI